MRKKFNTKNFNDGMLIYGDIKTLRDDTGQAIGDVFSEIGKCYFEFENIRQQDYDRFGASHQIVDLKVSTLYVANVDEALKVKVEDVVYEISRIDPTKDRKMMYWYLTKVGVFESDVRFKKD